MNNIAICLATYNGEDYLEDLINSIVPQMRLGDCIFCSDDGSVDKTLKILGGFEGVKIISSDRVGGVVKNFSRLLDHIYRYEIKYSYVALCDQDDVWLPNKLDEIRSALNTFDCVQLNGLIVDEKLNLSSRTIFEIYPPGSSVISNLINNSYVGCCLAFKSKLLGIALPFPRFTPWHDWYIGLVAQALFNVGQSTAASILYRRHGGNASPTGSVSPNSLLIKLYLRALILSCLFIAFYRRFILFLYSKKYIK